MNLVNLSPDLEILINSLNETRLQEVVEERLTMELCANFLCNRKVDPAKLKSSRTLKFVFDKEKGVRKVEETENVVLFCSGKIQGQALNSKNPCRCEEQYEVIKNQVEKVNEGGPFGTPMQKLAEMLQRL